jgi:hypothetical protein
MQTKDVLLVLGGVALGYFAVKMNLGRNTASPVGDVATGVTGVATGLVSDVKNIAVDTKKAVECEQKWNEIASLSRFASAEAGEKAKSDYLTTCMAMSDATKR